MDLDEFRSILTNSGTDIWDIINAAVTLASTDYPVELNHRRDGIIQRLYNQPCVNNCDVNNIIHHNDVVPTATVDRPLTPHQDGDDELFDDDQATVFSIKQQLEDPHQSDDAVVELLQTLADMELTFTGLKESDIGRHVNRLRKHRSNEVRSLVKQLVRKWKDLVDEWVGSKNGDHAPATLDDGDSLLVQNASRSFQNGHQQVPDFGYSPNPHNGSYGSERNNPEPEQQRTKSVVPKKVAPSGPVPQSLPAMVASGSASAPQNRANKEQSIDLGRLASARKRLQENYQEAQNAKKQRTIQVMDIHEIPKPRNGFIAKNKGNFQARHR